MGNYAREGHMLDSRMVELVKNHLDISISTNINDFDNVDCLIYNESTADGYDVYICTNDSRHPSICEDVYYYESDWLEKMQDAMTDGMVIYFQELNDDNYEFEDVVLNVYEEYYNDKRQELIEKLIDDGYEWEE